MRERESERERERESVREIERERQRERQRDTEDLSFRLALVLAAPQAIWTRTIWAENSKRARRDPPSCFKIPRSS